MNILHHPCRDCAKRTVTCKRECQKWHIYEKLRDELYRRRAIKSSADSIQRYITRQRCEDIERKKKKRR